MAIYCVIAFFGYVTTFVVLQNVIGRHFKLNNIGREESPWRLLLAVMGMLIFTLSLSTMQDEDRRPIPMVAGLLLILAGLIFSLWAQWVLGRNWVGGIALRKGHKLVTSGPYRFIRHPLYSGMLISAAGLALFSFNILFAVSCFMYAGSFLTRIPAEERLLLKKFKNRYEQYAATSGMLFPRLRK